MGNDFFRFGTFHTENNFFYPFVPGDTYIYHYFQKFIASTKINAEWIDKIYLYFLNLCH